MNPETGEIREINESYPLNKARKDGFTIRLRCKPKSNCPKCYGRGHIGKNDHGLYVPCACTQKRNG